jgi:hypothetical protein
MDVPGSLPVPGSAVVGGVARKLSNINREAERTASRSWKSRLASEGHNLMDIMVVASFEQECLFEILPAGSFEALIPGVSCKQPRPIRES